MAETETVVMQIKGADGRWQDFGRNTPQEVAAAIASRRFRGTFRGVDWISGKVVVDEQGREVKP